MKTLKIALIIATSSLVLVGCKKGGVFCYSPKGEVITETRNVSSFTEIDLATDADIYVTQSDVYSVSVTAAENLLPIIKTEVKGNRLLVDLKKNKCLKGNSNVVVNVAAPQIVGLSVSGSGIIFVQKELTTSFLDIDISGSGKIEIDSLITNDFSARISGSGEMTVRSTDTTANQEINISGSGSFHGYNMPTLNSDVNISGSGNCELNVSQKIKARISGSGKVTYKGTPTVDSDISGSGTIKPY